MVENGGIYGGSSNIENFSKVFYSTEEATKERLFIEYGTSVFQNRRKLFARRIVLHSYLTVSRFSFEKLPSIVISTKDWQILSRIYKMQWKINRRKRLSFQNEKYGPKNNNINLDHLCDKRNQEKSDILLIL